MSSWQQAQMEASMPGSLEYLAGVPDAQRCPRSRAGTYPYTQPARQLSSWSPSLAHELWPLPSPAASQCPQRCRRPRS